MTNSKIFIQNTTKMIHLKKYIRKVKHAAPILYFVWQFCLNQWELIQYNLSFPFYWSRTYLSHQTSHRNVSGPQIFPLSQPYKFSDSLCKVYYNPDDFFKDDNFGIWALPHLNFFKIMNQICFFSSIFLTPILYGKIFRFV